jgi:UDP-glucose 4-epimerase
MLSGKTVFVTGGAGFIGSHLVDASLAHGAARVIVLDNFTGGRLENLEHLRGDDRVSVTTGDVREMDTVAPLVAAADVIFHEAASKMIVSESHPRVDLETNIVGTFNLLQCLRGTEKVLLHASTGSVLGNSVEGEMQEDHPRNPSTLYGISKGCAEGYVQFYAREFGVNAGIVRYFHVCGPRQPHDGEAGVVSIFLGRVLRGLPPVINGTGEQIRCFTYVMDDVNANFLLLGQLMQNRCRGEIYNVASRTRVSVLELAKTVIERYGTGAIAPVFGPPRAGENLRPIPDTKKIESLGFRESVTFDEALELTKLWLDSVVHTR